jgi:hypothetical protein
MNRARRARQPRRWVALGGTATAALAVACSTLVGIDEPRERVADDAGRGAVDAWVGDAFTPAETSTTITDDAAIDSGSVPETDAGDAGVGCAPPPDDTMGVFVDGSAGHDATDCGTRQAACATIEQGVLRAQAVSKSLVYVAAGAYFGPVELVAGVTIQGGWAAQGTTWTAVCPPQSQGAVTISGSAQASATIVAQDVGGTAQLQTLTVLSKSSGNAAPGETVYGIMATGSTTKLVLQDVIVEAASGPEGAGGTMGPAGDPAPSGAAVPEAGCASGNGGTGTAGGFGMPAPAGSFTPSGYASSPGAAGAGGAGGHGGSAGTAGQCATTTCYCGPSTSSTCPTPYCGAAGSAGCGGGGGNGGTAGGGGGSSIPLFVAGATVIGSGGLLQAGNGGSGGAGGPGGPGGAGAGGAPGTATTCETACNCVPSFCCVPSDPVTLEGGAPGGMGGTGGAGGQGGGGTGGWSCAYASVQDASVTWNGTRLIVGEAGAGGPPNGVAGVAQERCP